MYKFDINIKHFDNLGYLKVIANVNEKHDRSTPSNYHWKVLKCRMIIFSTSSILSCPNKADVKQIHIILSRQGDVYDRLLSLFKKFSLTQVGNIEDITPEIFLECFHYTMSAKLAPAWNVLGRNYYINNRNFLTTKGFQNGVHYNTFINYNTIKLVLKPVKINIVKSKEQFFAGQKVKVLPSLNEALIGDFFNALPKSGDFKSYKDLRRHWKNIHGYRLPVEECPYYTVRFWCGTPLTYPAICLTENLPIIIPTDNVYGISIISKFINCLEQKMSYILGVHLTLEPYCLQNNFESENNENTVESSSQVVSLCSPTQK